MKTDNLTPEQRARVEQMKAERAKITNVFERIAFDNSANLNGVEFALHIIAAVESSK